MRNYLLLIWSAFMVLVLLVGCAATKLNDYKPKSTDEEEVIQVITSALDAWNKSEESEFSAEFCPNGKFAYRGLGTSRGEKIKVSMADIPKYFSLAQDSMRNYELEDPKLSIAGDKAILRAKKPGTGNYTWPVKILLHRENGEWCIEDWDFNDSPNTAVQASLLWWINVFFKIIYIGFKCCNSFFTY